MHQISRLSALAAAVMAGLAFSNSLRAAVIALDSASNSPYTAGSGDTATTEFNGENGGTGFGPWVFTDTEVPPATGATTDNGPGNGNGEAFINSTTNDATRNPAPIFDVYDNGNPGSSSVTGAPLNSSIATATRLFNTPLTGAGSSFQFVESLASLRGLNAGAQTSQLGFELLDSSGNVLLNLYTYGGATGFYAVDASNSGNPYELLSTDVGRSPERALTVNTGAADTITITLNDDSGDYTITSAGHEGSTFADGGQINMSTGGPAAFAIYNNNGGFGSDIRVNNLSENVVATPEPTTLLLGGIGLSGLLLRRRR